MSQKVSPIEAACVTFLMTPNIDTARAYLTVALQEYKPGDPIWEWVLKQIIFQIADNLRSVKND